MSDAPVILLFTKIPGAAAAKTRLQNSASLSPDEIQLLAIAFLADTLILLQRSKLELRVAVEPEISAAAFENLFVRLAEAGSGPTPAPLLPSQIFPQRGASFGTRLKNAIEDATELVRGGIIIVGSDAPSMPLSALSSATGFIRAGRPVIGPCFDGGVYLIGLPPELCSRSDWIEDCFGDPAVTEAQALTLACGRKGTPSAILPYHTDIDVVDDLVHLFDVEVMLPSQELVNMPEHTLAAFETLGIRVVRTGENNRRFEVQRKQ